MNLTLHAEERVAERLLMGKEALRELADELVHRGGNLNPPRWWYGRKLKVASAVPSFSSGSYWYPFKDVDGVECVALIDTELNNVVTVAKRDV